MLVFYVIVILDFNIEKELEFSFFFYMLVSVWWWKSWDVFVIFVNYVESFKNVMVKKEKRCVFIYNDVSKDFFEFEVIFKWELVFLWGLEIGRVWEKWILEYLVENGGERIVKIYVCFIGKMDFIYKNFIYK